MSLSTEEQLLLDAVERLEMRSLSWGYVDGSLARSKVVDLASLFAKDNEADEIIETLIEKRLLLEWKNRLRSRFAETVRLSTRLRQMFSAPQWRTAPNLVGDYRVDRRGRLFPIRNVNPRSVWEGVREPLKADEYLRSVWDSLTAGPDGEAFSLAQFQADAVSRLLASPNAEESATIITAGTGSGKTLCFYLPALVELSGLIKEDNNQALAFAVYPRKELLRDQLREAVSLTAKLCGVQTLFGKRSIRLGVLYGDTPDGVNSLGTNYAKSWKRVGNGYICPFLKCPDQSDCNGDLVWLDDDIRDGVERLVCIRANHSAVTNVVLTRNSLADRGCDLLFFTSEMLNQRMTDRRLRPVLGLDRKNKSIQPVLVLLDEVHTYIETTGAQVALTLRRWRNELGESYKVRWIGLSATLRDPQQFFSTITGLPAESVVIVAPRAIELEERGAEYHLILRGDPSGRTSLLSTTIQSAMLLGRMADTDANVSSGTVGQKVFAFTDDLDVTNRLYHNFADAEGYRVRNNRLVPSGRAPLATLRGPGSDAGQRDAEGQRWWAPEQIGHNLATRLPIGRTTGQDSGVDPNASVVIATASLEVGFNDPEVGFVLQHKAPRGVAAFLQRRGRAGRRTSMRPWTVTVLSDYGRDRAAFQSYEQLFDPTLPAARLPTDNLYVLRIQSTYALLEWLYARWTTKTQKRYANLWRMLARETTPEYDYLRQELTEILSRLVRGDETLRESLRRHLVDSLRVDPERVDLILWQPPRGLMLEVVPTLVRQLYRNWQPAFDGQRPERVTTYPLPDFLPPNLFSELELPEVNIRPAGAEETDVSLSLALNTVIPGKVTRRFAPFQSNLSHWIPVPFDSERPIVELAPYLIAFEPLDVPEAPILTLCPRTIRLDAVPPEIRETSNAVWEWATGIAAGLSAMSLPIPVLGPWHDWLFSSEAFTYSHRSPARVCRFANSAQVNALTRKGEEKRARVELSFEGEPAAIGFAQEVDALRLELDVPSDAKLRSSRLPSNVEAACTSTLFREMVRSDIELSKIANRFQLDWLAQAFLAAAISTAEERNLDIQSAIGKLTRQTLEIALEALFPSTKYEHEPDSDDEDEESSSADSAHSEQKLVQLLRSLLEDERVMQSLCRHACDATNPPEPVRFQWLRTLWCETLASAFPEAADLALPQNSAAETLLADWTLVTGSENGEPDRMTLWLTEQSLGGAGVVEELQQLASQEPRRLFRIVEAILGPNEFEEASEALAVLCHAVREDDHVADIASRCSEATGHAERALLFAELLAELRERGCFVGRTFGIAANARVLRPGMRRQMIALLADLHEYRLRIQERLGVIIDLRTFSRIAVDHEEYGERLRLELRQVRHSDVSAGEIAQILTGMLWPQPVELRAQWGESWHPYRNVGPTERELVRLLLTPGEQPAISLSDADWRAKVEQSLRVDGIATVTADQDKRQDLSDALVSFTVQPIDTDWLQLYASVERVTVISGQLRATLHMRELA